MDEHTREIIAEAIALDDKTQRECAEIDARIAERKQRQTVIRKDFGGQGLVTAQPRTQPQQATTTRFLSEEASVPWQQWFAKEFKTRLQPLMKDLKGFASDVGGVTAQLQNRIADLEKEMRQLRAEIKQLKENNRCATIIRP